MDMALPSVRARAKLRALESLPRVPRGRQLWPPPPHMGRKRCVACSLFPPRYPNEPYQHYGATRAVRYCSPTNRASSLTPEAFASYLRVRRRLHGDS